MVPDTRIKTYWRLWLPRLRGDGPLDQLGAAHDTPAPPPTRGWSRVASGAHDRRWGSPAYAGMVPISMICARLFKRLPRLRGDGPAAGVWQDSWRMAPPPTRGWSLRHAGGERHGLGSPAYAGMVPRLPRRSMPRLRLPRLRGDGPFGAVTPLDGRTAPPPTRGWSHRSARPVSATRGSPAYAGMVPPASCAGAPVLWLPRLRGDGPYYDGIHQEQEKAPPPTRGWSLLLRHELLLFLGSPAYAA